LRRQVNKAEKAKRKTMSKILAGVFVAVFVGALACEILNKSKPELSQRIKFGFSRWVDKVLMPAERNA
jgi:hypothetical protein